MDIRQIFARNLRTLRHERGFSQEELAYNADVDRSYMSRLERGATYAGLEIVEKLAKELKVDPADLFQRPSRKVVRPRKG